MLITIEEVKQILLLPVVSDVHLLKVIKRYIYDKKEIEIEDIARPQSLVQAQLLQIAIENCIKYYFK